MAFPGTAGPIRFGAFEFHPSSLELRKGRTRLRVPDQSLAILAMLLERPGELVTRESIQARLWPNGTVVEFENSVNSAVKRLREALLDTAVTPRYIETLPRKGYRFVGVLAPEEGGRAELTPGTVISHYRILGEAGRGAMGVVYKAEDTRLGRMAALKFLPEELVTNAPALERLRREAQMIGALNHPGICTVYELEEAAGHVFLVMEFLEGEPLRKRMARGPLAREEILDIATQAAKALEAAHGLGMVHRDIKPDNLFLTKQGAVKLLDFGLAKLVENESGAAVQTSITGTSGYMSPEQKRGEPMDARSDIYSLGRVLAELAGEPPPAKLAPILRQALAEDLAKRWQSAGELRAALERVQRRKRPRWSLVAALAAVAAVMVTGLWPISAPKVAVTQLTHGARVDSPCLVVYGGRILNTTYENSPPDRSGTEFWSISTQGGEPRRERMPFLNPKPHTLEFCAGSPDGILFIFTNVAPRGGDIWLAGFDGSKPRRIGEYVVDNGYSVSPDLKTLLRSGPEGLFARPVDGGQERFLARLDWKTPTVPFWHPSGERIGFYLFNKDDSSRLWEVKKDGSGLRLLLPDFQGEQTDARWSPDGKRLYFVSQGQLYKQGSRRWLGWMRRQDPERLTDGSIRYGIPAEDPTDPRVVYALGHSERGQAMKLNKQMGIFEPYLDRFSAETLDYSPDGQWIAYVTFPEQELWKCRRDGSDRVPLEDGLRAFVPRWSPDGKRLAFTAAKEEIVRTDRIYTIPSVGGKAELVKGVSGPGTDPNWSPDGKRLVFATWDGTNVPQRDQHISIVNLETGDVQMVPGSEGLYSPRWSPDGRHLIALTLEGSKPVFYDFETRKWMVVEAKGVFGFPAWSKDSKYVYVFLLAPYRLARIDAATRKLDGIRTIMEFRLTGFFGFGVSWTPDGEAVVLADSSAGEIYRIEVEH